VGRSSCTLKPPGKLDKNEDPARREPRLTWSTVQVTAENVDLVDEFVYLGSLISHDGGSEAEILRRITIARECFSLLEKNIWRSRILKDIKVHLYRTYMYILPV